VNNLYWNTVSENLKEYLFFFMKNEIFNPFRLVGGTALSLHLGHRLSIDIDLFSDEAYEAIDFQAIDEFLRAHFKIVSNPASNIIGFGRSYFIGNCEKSIIKLDLYYTETFLEPYSSKENVRIASINEIAAMKMDVIQRGGRKKDYWDIHEVMENISFEKLFDLHQNKYPYNHDRKLLFANLSKFDAADNEPDPYCLKGKYWELIKLDILDAVSQFK
jgi:predicted nucleotidyltransferase component of viral defense system